MSSFGEKAGTALAIDQPARLVGKIAFGIGRCFAPLGIEEEGPSAPEPPQHIVRSRACRDQFGFGRGFQIGSAKSEGALETAILVEDHTGRDQSGPRQMIGQPIGTAAIFGEVQHARYPF